MDQKYDKMQPWSFIRFQIGKNRETKGISGDNREELVIHHTLDNILSMPNARTVKYMQHYVAGNVI